MSPYNFYNFDTTPKHNTFISFHHANDHYKGVFETQWSEQFDGFALRSVGDGDINPCLSTDRIRQLIHEAFQRRKTCHPKNNRDSLASDRPNTQAFWRDWQCKPEIINQHKEV